MENQNMHVIIACYHCIMTISEAMIIESLSNNWWIDSTMTHHIARSKELFVELKEKKIGENKFYMGNKTLW